uniref:glutathione transferase n=2 Tax=Anopheles dirus TaxID=7168 RepID=A0A1Y9H324_9DIPT
MIMFMSEGCCGRHKHTHAQAGTEEKHMMGRVSRTGQQFSGRFLRERITSSRTNKTAQQSESSRLVCVRNCTANMATSEEMVLYYDEVSPPVRSVLMTIAALGLKDRVKLEYIDLFGVEHLKEYFLKVNPLHTIPVLRHGDLTLTDSHAILMYLCDTFAPAGHDLAIPDTLTRAKVFNRLCFNNGFLFQREAAVLTKVFRREITDPSTHLKPIEETIDALEIYLKESRYTALDHLSVADFSIVATVSTLSFLIPITADRWPRVHEWFEEMQTVPWYAENRVGLEKLRGIFNKLTKA